MRTTPAQNLHKIKRIKAVELHSINHYSSERSVQERTKIYLKMKFFKIFFLLALVVAFAFAQGSEQNASVDQTVNGGNGNTQSATEAQQQHLSMHEYIHFAINCL